MSGLFSKNNLLLSGMKVNNGLSAKTIFPRSPVQPFVSHF